MSFADKVQAVRRTQDPVSVEKPQTKSSVDTEAILQDLGLSETPSKSKGRLVAAGVLLGAGVAAAVTAVIMLGPEESAAPVAQDLRAPVPGETFERAAAPVQVEHPEVEDWVSLDGEEIPMTTIGSYGGSLEVPEASLAGLYEGLSAPGADQGSTLIAAHVDDADAAPGAFWSLHERQVGDEVVVFFDDEEHAYEIVSLQLYEQDALPAEIFDAAGDPTLYLMTCAGEPVENEGPWRYRYNLVAEAVPVDSESNVSTEESA